MDIPTADALRERDSTRLVEAIRNAAPTGQLSDGGTGGPFPCSDPKAGLAFYTVRWVLAPGSESVPELMSAFEASMDSEGYTIDRTQIDASRPTVIFRDGRREVSVTPYEETGVLQFTVNTECGAPSDEP